MLKQMICFAISSLFVFDGRGTLKYRLGLVPKMDEQDCISIEHQGSYNVDIFYLYNFVARQKDIENDH